MFWYRKIGVLLVLIAFLVLAAGCGSSTPGPQAPPADQPETPPRLSRQANFALPAGDFRWLNPGDVSDDGNYMALIINDGDREALWVYSLRDGEGREVYSIPAEELGAGRLVLVPVGWMGDNKLIFTRQGTQPDGAHRGERGLLLLSVSPESGGAEEAAWVANPRGHIKQVLLNRVTNDVLVHVGDSLWRVGLGDGSARTISTGLPGYDGLFFLQPSADRSHLVGQYYEPDKRGIYLMDAATGDQTPLAETGDTFSFSPAWSPDGRYIAFYTADARDGAPEGEDDHLGDKYDIVPGEDGPIPAAAKIEVVTPDGQRVTSLSVPGPGVKAAMFSWAPDSKHLAFLSARPTGLAPENLEAPLDWQALYLADLEGNITKLADIADETSLAVILQVTADSVYYLTYAGGGNTLWRAVSGQEPQQLTPPSGIPAPGEGFAPVYPPPAWEDSLLVSYAAGDQNYFLHVWRDQVELLAAESPQSFILATGDRKALLISPQKDGGNKLTVFAPEG